MQCATHPAYKGLKQPKSNCAACQQLYQTIRAKISGRNSQRKWGDRYVSISTPTHAYATQLLAELSTFMLYGVQRPYFWKSRSAAASHYMSMVKRLSAWRHRDRFIFDLFEQFMYHLYTQFKDSEVSNDVKFRQVVQAEPEDDEEPDIEIETDGVISNTARRRQFIMRKKKPDEIEEERAGRI